MKYQNYIEGSLGKSHKKQVKVGQNLTPKQVTKIRNLRKIYTVFQILSLFVPFPFEFCPAVQSSSWILHVRISLNILA